MKLQIDHFWNKTISLKIPTHTKVINQPVYCIPTLLKAPTIFMWVSPHHTLTYSISM